MKIELPCFAGCPGFAELAPRLRSPAGPRAIDLREIDSREAAERARFVGSPALRVDGADVEPAPTPAVTSA